MVSPQKDQNMERILLFQPQVQNFVDDIVQTLGEEKKNEVKIDGAGDDEEEKKENQDQEDENIEILLKE